MKNWIVSRLKERSTWLGIVTMATLFGWAISEEQKELVIQAGIGIGALIAAFTPDR